MKKVLKVLLIILLIIILIVAGGFAYLYVNGMSGMSNTTDAKDDQIKIACVGDSTTYGHGISGWPKNSYPSVLQNLLGENYHVNNYVVYILAGLAGGVLTGMAGLTAAMVLTPILCSVCGWSGYDAVTLSLIANVPSAMVTCWTFYKNGNIQMKKGMPMAVVAFAGAVVGSYLGYLFSMVSENGISYFVIISNLFMAVKFFMPTKSKKETLTAAEERKAQRKTVIALILGFLIGVECGFMGSAGGALMLMVLTMVMGMDTKLAVGTSSMIMTLVALTGAVSHVAMGAAVDLIPSIMVTIMCTIGAVGSAQFANKVSEKKLNLTAGTVLILVSVVSWLLSV